MNCYEHEGRGAVTSCGNCNVGLCKECEDGTIFRINNQALCRKCNFSTACENDKIYNSAIMVKKTSMIINSTACGLGVIVYIVIKLTGYQTSSAVIGMLICWGIGFIISNFFNKGKKTANKVPFFSGTIFEVIGRTIGIIFGFFIQALGSPIMIIANYIGINKVKKQIADNNEILASFNYNNEKINNSEGAFSADIGSRIYEYDGNFSYCPPNGWTANNFPDLKYKIIVGPIEDRFAININFIIDIFNGNFHEYVNNYFLQLSKDSKIMGREQFLTNSGISGECAYIDDNQGEFFLRQVFYLFQISDKKFIAITCSVPNNVSSKYLSLFNKTVKTFEIISISS